MITEIEKNEEIKERLKGRIFKDKNGCWNYTASKNPNGYGHLSAWGKVMLAHRVSYIVFRGEIPKGLFLDHLCRNRACINPSHLEIVTNRENILRGIGIPAKNYRKIQCIHGHKFDKNNTGYKPDGRRICLACKSIHNREYGKKYYKEVTKLKL